MLTDERTQYVTVAPDEPNQDFLHRSIFFQCHASAVRNSNFVLLALIVEKVSGVPFCDFIHQNIFIPLGMLDSWIFDPLSVRSSATKGYKGSRWKEDEMVPTDGVTGDKNIYSTVRDLYKWDQALLAGKLIRSEFLLLQVNKWYVHHDRRHA